MLLRCKSDMRSKKRMPDAMSLMAADEGEEGGIILSNGRKWLVVYLSSSV